MLLIPNPTFPKPRPPFGFVLHLEFPWREWSCWFLPLTAFDQDVFEVVSAVGNDAVDAEIQ